MISECRVYVVHGEIRAVCQYVGSAEAVPDLRIVKEASATLASSEEGRELAGYAIDFAVMQLGNGKIVTGLIEVNDGFSLGHYDGMSGKDYTDIFIARWQQLVGSFDARKRFKLQHSSTAMDEMASLSKKRKDVAEMAKEFEFLSRQRVRIEQQLEQTRATLKEAVVSTWKDDSIVSASIRYAASGELVAIEGCAVEIQRTMTIKSLRQCIAVAAGQKESGLFFAKLRVVLREEVLSDGIVVSEVVSPTEAAQDFTVIQVAAEVGASLNYPGFDGAIVLNPAKVRKGIPPKGSESCPECGGGMWIEERSCNTHSDICPCCEICVSNDMGGP
jgi:hypothetical protein